MPNCSALLVLATPCPARCLIMIRVSCRISGWSPPAHWERSCLNLPPYAQRGLYSSLPQVVASAATPLRPGSPAYGSVKFANDVIVQDRTDVDTLLLGRSRELLRHAPTCHPHPKCLTGRSHRQRPGFAVRDCRWLDRKSTRLNSSHVASSYAVFCLKKKVYE